MEHKFSFDLDRRRGVVRIAMRGFFTLEDIAAFDAARREAHRVLNWPPHRHMTLNDITEMKIQPQQSVDAFQAMLSAPELRSRKLAFVAAPNLARSQVVRAVAGRAATGFFASIGEAEAWLFEEHLSGAGYGLRASSL